MTANVILLNDAATGRADAVMPRRRLTLADRRARGDGFTELVSGDELELVAQPDEGRLTLVGKAIDDPVSKDR